VSAGSGICVRRVGIPNYSLDVCCIRVRSTAGSLRGCAEPVVIRCLVRLDDNFIPLADSNRNDISRVRLDRDEIRGDNGHSVVVQRDLEKGIRSHINEPQEVLLPGFEFGKEAFPAADAVSVRA